MNVYTEVKFISKKNSYVYSVCPYACVYVSNL